MKQATPARTPPVLPVPLRARASALLHSQCWLWGCDVRHQPNLLVELGFSRIAFPNGVGPTRYQAVGDTESIGLWGWGIAYGCGDHAVLLQRYAFEPRLFNPTRIAAAWTSDDLRAECATTEAACRTAREQAVGAVEWIVSYEERVESLAGAAYRREALAKWSQASMSVEELHDCWRSLAFEIRSLPLGDSVVYSAGQ